MSSLKALKVETRSDLNNILHVLKHLRAEFGFFTGANYRCCSDCVWAEIEENYPDRNVVFWTNTEHEKVFDGAVLKTYLPLFWRGDSAAIVEAFEKAGFVTYWDGEWDGNIYIMTPEIAARTGSV